MMPREKHKHSGQAPALFVHLLWLMSPPGLSPPDRHNAERVHFVLNKSLFVYSPSFCNDYGEEKQFVFDLNWFLIILSPPGLSPP